MKQNRVVIIAEAGVNHNGDINIAKKLIDVAAEAKVDYVKFQTWITEDIVDTKAPKAQYQIDNDPASSQYEMLKRLELSFKEFKELKEYCGCKGVKFLSTPDDYKSLNFLIDDLGLDIVKVGSGELTNIPFLRRIGNKGKDVILSTGMGNLGEVEKAYSTLIEAGARKVSILHCTSNYPAPYNTINLKAMLTIKQAFNVDVGYSDHTEGNEVSIAAVALGATIIEKHYTLDRGMDGPDHKASINPDELVNLVNQIRNVELAILGDGTKKAHNSEIETKKVVSKGIYLAKSIDAGEYLTDDYIALKRPVGNIPASEYDLIINKRVKRSLMQGDVLKKGDIELE